MDQFKQYLIIILIISLGFGQLLRFEILGLPIFLHDILVLCILIINTTNLRGPSSQHIRYTPGLKLVFLGLVIGVVRALTLFPLADLLIPVLYSLRLLAYLFLYLSLHQKPLTIGRTPFLIAGVISLTIGLAQYVLMPDMRVFQYLGWDDHLSRLTLPHFDPTFSAAFLAISLLFMLPTQTLPVLPLALALGILLTYSRSIWLSLVLTIFLFAKRKISPLFVICSLLFVIFVALPRQFGEGTNLLRTFSITSRWEHDLELASRVGWDFVPGIGYNTLPLILDPATEGLPNHATGFNNSFLMILASTGIIGLTGWIIFLRSLYIKHSHLRPVLVFLVIGSIFNNLILYPFLLLFLLMAPNATSHD